MTGTAVRPGAAGNRTEGPEKVTGTARYAYEHPVPGAVYAYPLQAPVASGTIGALDAAEALAMPGVIAVLRGGNTRPPTRRGAVPRRRRPTRPGTGTRSGSPPPTSAPAPGRRCVTSRSRCSARIPRGCGWCSATAPCGFVRKDLAQYHVATAAAIGNAVWHATGRRIRDLPITPAKVLSPERSGQ